MNWPRRFVIPCVVLGVVSIFQLAAQTMAVELDPAKTKIEFTLGAVAHTVHGTFKLKSGHIEVSPENKSISGQLTVDGASGESGSESRDSRMKKSILEVDRYPEITFTPTAIAGDLSAATITGWFQIHGQRHQLSIPMRVKISGSDVTATGKFLIPYVAWGMKNPSTFILRVDQQVEVAVSAAGSISK